MLLVTGTFLVLVTWIVVLALVLALGAGPAAAIAPGSSAIRTSRRALWWGLAILFILVMAINVFLPMASPGSVLIVLTTAVGSLVAAWILRSRRELGRRPLRVRWTPLSAAVVIALVVAQGYLALAALGPLTNYDSGLYHLGAIEYARLFPTIPGLANVHSPLGYSTAEFPLAAILGAGPWGPEGLRLTNGLLMATLALDFALRAAERRRGPGFSVLAVGLAASWVPLLALSDYWVTSPSQDTAALILSVAAAAYLSDAVGVRRSWAANAATGSVAAISLSLIRPTLGAFTLGVILVAGVLAFRRGWPKRSIAAVAIAGAAAAAVTAMRDTILSGWLLFPASVFPLPVEWRAPDPTFLRLATLGYHRDPLNLWDSVDGWTWIPAWIQRLPQSWETYEFGLLALAAALAVLAASRWTNLRARGLLLAMAPSTAAVVVWFTLAPPSFRFAWGPIFTLAAVPLGWSLWRLSYRQSKKTLIQTLVGVGVAVPVLIVVVVSALNRFDYASVTQERTWSLGLSIPYAVSPLPEVEREVVTTIGSVELLVPTANEQCWGTFPLCTPTPLDGLTPRGAELSDGFVVY
mgnify:FL=1